MSIYFESKINRLGSIPTLLAALCLLFGAPSLYADPPPWAPAHGYRAKQKNKHAHKHKKKERKHHSDSGTYEAETKAFGILEGACYRETVGAVIGGATGAVVGSRIGKGDGKTVAIIAGTAIGALVGAVVGKEMDQNDQHCVAQTLERAPDGQSVAWRPPEGGHYEVTPVRTFQRGGRDCREYRMEGEVDGRLHRTFDTACRDAKGGWETVN